MTTTTGHPYSVLTITDALPDGRAFEIRYLNMTEDAPAAALWADALGHDEDARKRAYMERLGLDPDAPTEMQTVWHGSDRGSGECRESGTHECPDYPRRRWLAHWRDELARLNGTDSATARAIIREAVDAFDSPPGLFRFVWVLA